MAKAKRARAAGKEDGVWILDGGSTTSFEPGDPYRPDGVENLTYSNPYGLELERIWFDGRIVFAVESGEVEIAFDESHKPIDNDVAQEYQIVYGANLDDAGKFKGDEEPERVPGQFNIYDSVPGMDNYSPLWQFNYVIVPRDYEANTLRSEADCLASGYPILKSTIVEN